MLSDARARPAADTCLARSVPNDHYFEVLAGDACLRCPAHAPWHLVRLGQFEEASHWTVKAAARPNAHPHILVIAAYSLALPGLLDEARAYATTIRRTLPRYRVADFFYAFRFDADGVALFRKGVGLIGMAS